MVWPAVSSRPRFLLPSLHNNGSLYQKACILHSLLPRLLEYPRGCRTSPGDGGCFACLYFIRLAVLILWAVWPCTMCNCLFWMCVDCNEIGINDC